MSKKKDKITIRSSAAEYLTFITASGEGGVDAVYADENVWLSQKIMAELYSVAVSTVNEHLKKIFFDSELEEDSETQFEKYRVVQDRLFESDFERFLESSKGEEGEYNE